MTDKIFVGGALFPKNFKHIKVESNYRGEEQNVIVKFEEDDGQITLFTGNKSQCLQYMVLLNQLLEEVKKGSEDGVTKANALIFDFQIEVVKKEEELAQKEKEVQAKLKEAEHEKEAALLKSIRSLPKDEKFEVEQFVKLKEAQVAIFHERKFRGI